MNSYIQIKKNIYMIMRQNQAFLALMDEIGAVNAADNLTDPLHSRPITFLEQYPLVTEITLRGKENGKGKQQKKRNMWEKHRF